MTTIFYIDMCRVILKDHMFSKQFIGEHYRTFNILFYYSILKSSLYYDVIFVCGLLNSLTQAFTFHYNMLCVV